MANAYIMALTHEAALGADERLPTRAMRLHQRKSERYLDRHERKQKHWYRSHRKECPSQSREAVAASEHLEDARASGSATDIANAESRLIWAKNDLNDCLRVFEESESVGAGTYDPDTGLFIHDPADTLAPIAMRQPYRAVSEYVNDVCFSAFWNARVAGEAFDEDPTTANAKAAERTSMTASLCASSAKGKWKREVFIPAAKAAQAQTAASMGDDEYGFLFSLFSKELREAKVARKIATEQARTARQETKEAKQAARQAHQEARGARGVAEEERARARQERARVRQERAVVRQTKTEAAKVRAETEVATAENTLAKVQAQGSAVVGLDSIETEIGFLEDSFGVTW
ncbi:hypothetical protein CMI47_09375 [Candidatus Pacearchaeota archaeon]|nr:hypothetical protein [Candidatus Pacearchaeota archaeon]|tara:strand:- start:1447 stop:2484 length:1038 start_codon:yes stop_codon:yes gene_type:complete